MKVRVEREVLADAVAWAVRSVPARPPVPILAGLLLSAQDDVLTVSGFDYEASARIDVHAEIAEPGQVLVSGRLLADIARSLPPAPVQFATDGAAGQKVTLSCGSARFTLLTLPLEDYPTLPPMPVSAGTISGDLLATAVAQVAIAAGRDDTLPVLTGVRIEVEGGTLTLAATDRYRLAVRSIAWTPEQSGLSTVALVPARVLLDTAKALASADKVLVALTTDGGAGEGMIGFDGGGRQATTRLLDGEFPKYNSLFPSGTTTTAVVETAPFTEAVKRVALVAERNTPVRLTFSEGVATLEAGTGEDAQAAESLEASLDGEDMSIAFNPGYLVDGLGAVGAAWTSLSFTAPTRPAVLQGRSAADAGTVEDYRYLLMPVRLSG